MDVTQSNIEINNLVNDATIKKMVGDITFTKHRDGTVSMRTTVENMERIHRALIITTHQYPTNVVSHRVFRRLSRLFRNGGIDRGIW